MNDGAPRPVHQIFIGLKSREGIGIVAHTMTSDNEALSWQRKLENHVRLLPWETETALPEKALSYYCFGEHAVVLRRWAVGGNLGRSNAHALIGPIDVLTVPVALGLDSGFAWQPAAVTAPMPLVGLELVGLAQDAAAELRDQATREPEILRRALRKLIDARATPLTIIGCPDAHRVALTWALVHIGDEYLKKACQTHRRWTFSTYEIEDADSILNIPEILFMPGRPTGRGVARREIVDVRHDEAGTREAHTWANALVPRFLAGELLLPEFENLTAGSASEAMLSPAGQPERREQARTPEQSVSAPRQDQTDLGRYPKIGRQEAARSFPPLPAPARYGSGPKHLEREIVELLNSKDERELDMRLAALGRVVEGRTEIRRLLGVDGYLKIVAMIVKWHPPIENRFGYFRQLRVVTFGPDGRDLSYHDVAAFAAQLIAHPAAPDLFVRGLVQEIDEHGQSDRVDPALATRWREQRELAPARDLTGAPPDVYGPIARANAGPLSAVTPALRHRKWPLAVVVGLALLAPLFFVLGRCSVDTGTAAARSNSAGSQPAPPTSSDRAGTPAGQAPGTRGIAEVSGGVTTNDLVIRGPSQITAGMSVFLLLRTVGEEAIYPRGECKVDAREWVCANTPLTRSAASPLVFEVLVVKINSQVKQSYQEAVDRNNALPSPPDPKAVIFMVAGLA